MNPLNFLPRIGEMIQIPGGALWCERWEVSRVPRLLGDEFDGTVVFRFSTSDLHAVDPFKTSMPAGPMIEISEARVLPLIEGGAK